MLESDLTEVIAEGQQEFVSVVMRRTEKGVCLTHELAMRGQLLRLDCERFGTVRDEVQMHRRLRTRVQIEASEIVTGEQRRVHQHLESGGLEVDYASVALIDTQRSRKLPSPRAE